MILAGDNAHVGAALISRGRMLLQMCATASLLVCTGQIAGDQASLPTLAATKRTQPTRPDHILANAAAVPLLNSVVVSHHQRGSDHWLLHLKMELRCQPLQPCSGQPIPCRRWAPQARPTFCDALESQAPPTGPAQQDVSQINSQLHSRVTSAAHAAGMPLRLAARQRPGRACPHQPFFDAECRSLKRQVRTAAPDDRKELERHYHSVVRRKKRAYRMTRLQQLVNSQCLQQRSFWVKLHHRPPQLPLSLQSVQSWEPFMTKVADARLPQALSMPDCAYPQHGAAQAVALDSAITSAEIVSQLPRLHNGRSAGHADLPAEFLHSAQQPPQPQQPPPPHLLAPTLADFFTAMMNSGDVPASVNLALITPCHKRGSKADTGNYRPIAVTHPLMRLYAGILNTRLLDYTEEHDLRAPSQAGFRPHQSVVHQIFSLQHLIDKRMHAGQHKAAVGWDPQQQTSGIQLFTHPPPKFHKPPMSKPGTHRAHPSSFIGWIG